MGKIKPSNRRKYVEIVFFIVAILGFLLIRTKYHQAALETDEGQYAYGAQELLRGYLPYVSYHVNKLPGIILIYAFSFILFGQSVYSIKLVATLAVIASSILIYLITRNFFSKRVSLVSSILFLYSLSLPYIQSAHANTEIFMIVFLLWSSLLLLKNKKNINYFYSGILIGVSILIKTVAIGNYFAIVTWFLVSDRKRFVGKTLAYSLGMLIPIFTTVVFFIYKGAFGEFWFSNVLFNRAYLSNIPVWNRIMTFHWIIISENPGLWMFGLVGIVFILLKLKKGLTSELHFALNILIPLFVIQYLGRGFGHYYIQIVPFLLICGVFGFLYIYKKISKLLPTVSLLLFAAISFVSILDVVIAPIDKLVTMSRPGERGEWYDLGEDLSKEISKYVQPGDFIYNLGREGEIYFYTKTRSSSRFLNDRTFYSFPDTLDVACQDLAENKPRLIVFTLKDPYFNEEKGLELWEKLRQCGNLEISEKEEAYFAEIWHIK